MRYITALIVVEDMARSRRFYEDVLGQNVEVDYGENVAFEGGFSIHERSHFSSLLGGATVSQGFNSFELYFEEDDLEGLEKRLGAEDVELAHGVEEQPWRQKTMRFYDPDRHLIEVGERMEHVAYRLHQEGLPAEQIATITYLGHDAVTAAIEEYSNGSGGEAGERPTPQRPGRARPS
jgi:catechol 2,3-dioxygenase-like lactoylglutathione lyase family enzyme